MIQPGAKTFTDLSGIELNFLHFLRSTTLAAYMLY